MRIRRRVQISSLLLVLCGSLGAAHGKQFVIKEKPKDLASEISAIKLSQEKSVQPGPKTRAFEVSMGLGRVEVPGQTYRGRDGFLGQYDSSDRPLFLGRLHWLPQGPWGRLGLSGSVGYFNLESSQLALHFVPVGLGPSFRVGLGSRLELGLGYEWTEIYVEQVGLDQAKGSEWQSAQRAYLGLELPLHPYGWGDQWTDYRLGLVAEEFFASSGAGGLDFNFRSLMLRGSLSL